MYQGFVQCIVRRQYVNNYTKIVSVRSNFKTVARNLSAYIPLKHTREFSFSSTHSGLR